MARLEAIAEAGGEEEEEAPVYDDDDEEEEEEDDMVCFASVHAATPPAILPSHPRPPSTATRSRPAVRCMLSLTISPPFLPPFQTNKTPPTMQERRLELEAQLAVVEAASAAAASFGRIGDVAAQSDAAAAKPMQILWRYHCSETHGRHVTCMAWNERDSDLLAVAYGPNEAERAARSAAQSPRAAAGASPTPLATGGNGGNAQSGAAKASAGVDQSGLICLWSLKNPEFPLRFIRTGPRDDRAHEQAHADMQARAAKANKHAGEGEGALEAFDAEGGAESGITPTGRIEGAVLSLAFSKVNPQLLAAGMSTGMVALWDLADTGATEGNEDRPQLASHHAQQHKSGVSEVVWVAGAAQRGGRGAAAVAAGEGSDGAGAGGDASSSASRGSEERLLSISTDGCVKQWNLRKGLACSELMKLKRTKAANGAQSSGWRPTAGDSSGEGGFLSRHGSGLCLAVQDSNTTFYFAGTEDGTIHKCSSSHTEEFVATFAGHTAPVYALRCNPHVGGLFASCSADATICLWAHDEQASLTATAAADTEPLQTLLAARLEDRKIVNDIVWSAANPSVLGSVTCVFVACA